MVAKKKVFDSVSTNRTIEIMVEDSSTIELTLGIYLNSEVGRTNANVRLNSPHLSRILFLVEHLLITACNCSDLELADMAREIDIKSMGLSGY